MATGVRPVETRVERAASLDELPVEWAELADAQGNVFATPEWLQTWWQHYGDGQTLLAAAVYSEDRVAAILPLYRWSAGPFRVIRLLGHPAGGLLGPICAPDDVALAADGLRVLLARERHDAFVAENLDGAQGWPEALGAPAWRHTASPVVDLDAASWQDYLATRSSNFRQQLTRLERKLTREHGLEYRLSAPDRLEADLDLFFELHGRRWNEETPFSRAEAFHRDFARLASARGWLRLWFMELDGEAAAAWYGFRFGGIELFYQTGRDPSWGSLSVGRLLVAHTIRAALEDGLGRYELGHGGGSYKYRFATRDPGRDTVVVARTLAARTGKALLGARRIPGVKRGLRRVLSA